LDNLVRSGTKQPNPISASAGGLAHPPLAFALKPLQSCVVSGAALFW